MFRSCCTWVSSAVWTLLGSASVDGLDGKELCCYIILYRRLLATSITIALLFEHHNECPLALPPVHKSG